MLALHRHILLTSQTRPALCSQLLAFPPVRLPGRLFAFPPACSTSVQLMDEARSHDTLMKRVRQRKATLTPLFCVPVLVKDNYDVVSTKRTENNQRA